jgi:hypothetical protein
MAATAALKASTSLAILRHRIPLAGANRRLGASMAAASHTSLLVIASISAQGYIRGLQLGWWHQLLDGRSWNQVRSRPWYHASLRELLLLSQNLLMLGLQHLYLMLNL